MGINELDYKEIGLLIKQLIKILPITRIEVLDKFEISDDMLSNIEEGNIEALGLKEKCLAISLYLTIMRLSVNSVYGAFRIPPHMI